MLYVITATLNNLEHTHELLRMLLLASVSIEMRVVVVDNGSTDGTVENLASLWGPGALTVLPFEANQGVPMAWNTGIRFAYQNGAEAVLVCGNDTAPLPGCVERLYAGLRSGMLFVTGTQCAYDTPIDFAAPVSADAPLLVAPDYSFFMFRPRDMIERMGALDVKLEYINKQAWHKAQGDDTPYQQVMSPWDYGLFDTGYALGYFEDNDHHRRAQLAGIRCVRDPSAVFRHDCSLTIRTNAVVAQQNQSTFQRNAERFRAKWGGMPHQLDVLSAQPPNVTAEQWAAMSGGRPVEHLDRAQVIEDANRVYAQHGVTSS